MWKLIWKTVDHIIAIGTLMAGAYNIEQDNYEMATFWFVIFLVFREIDKFAEDMQS